MVDDDLQKIAENKALQMVYNQIRVRAHTGALYLGQGGCWITDTKSENADDDQSTNSSIDKAFYENILIKEALTEAWLYNIQDRSDEINLKDLTKILNWDKLELNLNEATIISIYEELPKDKTGNSVLVKNFLSKIKAAMQTAYVTNNENETYHWRKMWSQKTGQFYFNLRTGCCQYAEPRA
ncbi:uncharacterized protein TRIADDRAFT_57335 [Trichoplax adhaerens]|uniref:WW domain-containing protein n=1 Tax=Trichoplax adhaerens TaxID=10228 RepID=B3RZ57_TRIAD|nr:predicted protein [Trichoplax adhaerens]EDV23786.1 predicted protein [Trichoplax adhaerens]|eukprot:XP_002113312.1 predicted protein [Trichoplax adhaerens]